MLCSLHSWHASFTTWGLSVAGDEPCATCCAKKLTPKKKLPNTGMFIMAPSYVHSSWWCVITCKQWAQSIFGKKRVLGSCSASR